MLRRLLSHNFFSFSPDPYYKKANPAGPLELSDVPQTKYKPADDEDSLQVYGGTKLLQDDASGPRKRGRHGNDHQLLPDTDINGVFATEGDSDAERHGR